MNSSALIKDENSSSGIQTKDNRIERKIFIPARSIIISIFNGAIFNEEKNLEEFKRLTKNVDEDPSSSFVFLLRYKEERRSITNLLKHLMSKKRSRIFISATNDKEIEEYGENFSVIGFLGKEFKNDKSQKITMIFLETSKDRIEKLNDSINIERFCDSMEKIYSNHHDYKQGFTASDFCDIIKKNVKFESSLLTDCNQGFIPSGFCDITLESSVLVPNKNTNHLEKDGSRAIISSEGEFFSFKSILKSILKSISNVFYSIIYSIKNIFSKIFHRNNKATDIETTMPDDFVEKSVLDNSKSENCGCIKEIGDSVESNPSKKIIAPNTSPAFQELMESESRSVSEVPVLR